MSSYLFVAVLGCSTFLKVETPEDSVLTKALLNFQLCVLHPLLLFRKYLRKFCVKLFTTQVDIYHFALAIKEDVAWYGLDVVG